VNMANHPTSDLSRRDFLRLGAAATVLGSGVLTAEEAEAPPTTLIGYAEFRTNLPGGRHINIKTRRAVVVQADGKGRRVLGEELSGNKDTWLEFPGWSRAGKPAIPPRGGESDENGKWEEEHGPSRLGDGWRYDGCLFDLATGKATNVTAVERVSHYN